MGSLSFFFHECPTEISAFGGLFCKTPIETHRFKMPSNISFEPIHLVSIVTTGGARVKSISLGIYLLLASYMPLSLPIQLAAESGSVNDVVEQVYKACAEKWGFAGPIATCIEEKEREYGDALARVYREALAVAGSNAHLLRDSQRAWLKFQQINCQFFHDMIISEGPSFGRSSEENANCASQF